MVMDFNVQKMVSLVIGLFLLASLLPVLWIGLNGMLYATEGGCVLSTDDSARLSLGQAFNSIDGVTATGDCARTTASLASGRSDAATISFRASAIGHYPGVALIATMIQLWPILLVAGIILTAVPLISQARNAFGGGSRRATI